MKMMHSQSAFFSTLLIVCILLLSSSPQQGYAREMGVLVKEQGIGKMMRELTEVMDYGEPGANTNPRNRYQVPPPPPPLPF